MLHLPSITQAVPVFALPGVSVRQPATIQSLPNDVLLLVISYIHVKDILSLRKTCKRLYSLTKLRWVWHDAVRRHVINKGLPLPAIDIDIKTLSAHQIETRAVHAAKFHDNWRSERPKPRRSVEFDVSLAASSDTPTEHASSIQQLLFLRRRNGEFLVMLTGGMIACWEVPLDGSGAYLVAEHKEVSEIKQIIVNTDAKHDVDLAYWTTDERTQITYVRTLSLDIFHGRFSVRAGVLGTRPQCTPLHAMHGGDIVMGNLPSIWRHANLSHFLGPISVITLPTSPLYDPDDLTLAVKLIGQYLLCVRQRSIELFAKPTWCKKLNSFRKTVSLNALLQTESVAHEAVICTRSQSDRTFDGWPAEPVTILRRTADDDFNAIEQYDLPPNPRARHYHCDAESGPEELPCLFPARDMRILSVAPSCCNLRVSHSGKGFWMETRNLSARHSVFPARCLVGFDISRSLGAGEAAQNEGRLGMKGERPASTGAENVLHLCEGELYARRCTMQEINWHKYMVVSADLEDTIGRIAVGDREGKVVVLDYV